MGPPHAALQHHALQPHLPSSSALTGRGGPCPKVLAATGTSRAGSRLCERLDLWDHHGHGPRPADNRLSHLMALPVLDLPALATVGRAEDALTGDRYIQPVVMDQ
jgi:hypothetical protein